MGDADARDVVYGGQLLAQTIQVADRLHPGRPVRSLFTIFARPGKISEPTVFVAEGMVDGRSLASETVTAWQGERLCSRAMVLLDGGDDHYLDHGPGAPDVGMPSDAAPSQDIVSYPGCETRIVDNVDTWSSAAPVGPPIVQVWLRWPDGPVSLSHSQSLLAYATDGYLIGAAMRPYEGVGQDLAHRELSTGVITHSMTFHTPFQAHDWMLMSFEAPYAGHGRIYGRGQVFQDGKLVASLIQDSIVRALPGGGDVRTAM
jgi:acyl-CoA thioesterase II